MQPIRLISGIAAAFTTVILLLAACGAIPPLTGINALNETISIHGTYEKINGNLIVVDGQSIQLPDNFVLPDNAHPGDQLVLEVKVGSDGTMIVDTLEVEVDNTAEPTEAVDTPEASDTPEVKDTAEPSDTPEVLDTVEAQDSPESMDTPEPGDTPEPADTPETGDGSGGGGSGGGGDGGGGGGGSDGGGGDG